MAASHRDANHVFQRNSEQMGILEAHGKKRVRNLGHNLAKRSVQPAVEIVFFKSRGRLHNSEQFEIGDLHSPRDSSSGQRIVRCL